MDRLTIRPDVCDEIWFENPDDPEGGYNIFDLAKYAETGDGTEAQVLLKIAERLAAYEDTGLSPEEIGRINTFAGSQMEKLLAENARLGEQLEQAKKCIYDIETYLHLGSGKYIQVTVNQWRWEAAP